VTPDKVQARKMVLVGAFLLAALAVYRDHKGSQRDTFHALWGVGVVSLALSVLADFAPTIAGPFAMLTVLGSLASGDASIIDRVFGKPVQSTTTAKGGASK
jgi:hypothetical protein